MQARTLKGLSRVCLAAGMASIVASLGAMVMSRNKKEDLGANMSIFIGLWPPTFFALADRLAVAALEEEEGVAQIEERLMEEERIQSPHPLAYVRR